MAVIFLREKLRGLLRPRRHQITVLRPDAGAATEPPPAVLRQVTVAGVAVARSPITTLQLRRPRP